MRACAIKRLFHIEEALEAIARDIQTKSKALAGLRAEHGEYEKALDDVRAELLPEQARARTAVVREVKKVKKAEKALEAKEPELVEVDAQIKRSFSKLQKSQKITSISDGVVKSSGHA
ncbi:hypothetical protein CY34DRAFT_19141 [Suillus luteus UH-Slu-Lm8-n1]|uniref:Unplaced genomic scaffold CY34scaffold_1165, whole genome shotgun sequence n=1 Tax=Suillus luteus UH-Slu-Lm8-n1 TaxID=930992 RepID=A0A0D0AK29_9AGAM|nr:hypothetical protein CY34DRAFT_19141 [Suillus luteus UH-Slu-Lm8-n1]